MERAIDDPRSFVTTYEGKHNHEMPLKNTGTVASERDSQASLSKDKAWLTLQLVSKYDSISMALAVIRNNSEDPFLLYPIVCSE